MLKTDNISKIGIGTWGIGGFAERNPNNDDQKQIEALTYMLNRGLNFVEASYWYAEGKSMELLSSAISDSKCKRSDIFISSTIYPFKNPTIADAESEIDKVLSTLNSDYLDLLVINLSSLPQWGKNKTKELLNKVLNQKMARYVGVTNFDLENLIEFKNDFGDNLFSHELVFNFEIRENKDLGIIDYAFNHNIKNIIFQPLRRNRTVIRNWPLLVELSSKYSKSQNQIILNWLVKSGYLPLTKSENISHIDEHIESINFTMAAEDYVKIDNFRPLKWKGPKIDWYKSGDGVQIAMYPNIFDEEYDRQLSSF